MSDIRAGYEMYCKVLAQSPEGDLSWDKMGDAMKARWHRLYNALTEQLRAERDALAAQVYVPGLWKCAKCNFRLVDPNMGDGSITARNAGDKCPNCDGPLWRVSEREDREETERLLDAADADAKTWKQAALVAAGETELLAARLAVAVETLERVRVSSR